MVRTKVFLIAVMLTTTSVLTKVEGQQKKSKTRATVVGNRQKTTPPISLVSHALLIFVEKYDDQSLRLYFPKKNVEQIQKLLIEKYNFKSENVTVLSDPDRRQILTTLRSYSEKLSKNDSLLIFYAGHGHYEKTLEEGFWFPRNAKRADPTEWVSNDDVRKWIKAIKTQHTLLISDACFSGSLLVKRSATPSVAIKELMIRPSRKAITSDAGAEVQDDSVLVKFILETLSSNKQQYLTARKLFESLQESVANNSRIPQIPLYGAIQEAGDRGGEYVFELRQPVSSVTNNTNTIKQSVQQKTSFSKKESKERPETSDIVVTSPGQRRDDSNQQSTSDKGKSHSVSKNAETESAGIKNSPNNQTNVITIVQNPVKPLKSDEKVFPRPANSTERFKPSIFTVSQYTTGVFNYGNFERRQGACAVLREDLGNGALMEMVRIPGGKFTMGSPESEYRRSTNEGPQREVNVSEFLMGRYEVTQRIWRVVAGLPEEKIYLNPEPSAFKGEDLPVENITPEQVKEFIARLNRKLGLAAETGYRLPSEAEWEFAARAGTATPFAFGETIDNEIVNYDGNYPYGDGEEGAFRSKTVAVGSLGVANGWGLYDMHGNVWEWCEDEYHSNYDGAPVDGSAWVSSAQAARRVMRGGGWGNGAVNCRSAVRRWLTPGRRDFVGFRLSRTLPSALLPSGRD